MRNLILFCLSTWLFVSCGFDDGPELPSVEEREAEAIADLKDLLTAPSEGWRIDYRPTNGTGSFFILLDFREDDFVRIQSDVAANDGQFRDQTIPYRIDNAQGLELILETYAVFHYLFELEQASFGGEFEFIFVEEEGNNLVFASKTDAVLGENTVLRFEPASSSDENLISLESFDRLGKGIFQSENLAGVGNFATYNIYLENNNHTISSTLNLDRRTIKFHGIAQGQTQSQIITNNFGTAINREVTFGILNDRITLDQSQSVSFDGSNYTISEIPLDNFNQFADSFCVGQTDSLASFNSDGAPSLGDVTITSSLFQTHSSFQPGPDVFFSVNYIFLYDDEDISIRESIESVFPDVQAFQWYYGLELGPDSLLNAVGFVTVDEFNNAEFFLRQFDVVQNGNQVIMTFTGENFITEDNPTMEQINGLEQLTDEIFSGGEVFILEVSTINDLFEFYNPCNKYKGFIL